MDGAPGLQELVERRGALRARMLQLRAESPDDHDGFLRTVDQLLAVSNRIVDLVSAPPEAARPGGEDGAGGSAVEGRADQGPPGGAEDHGG